MKFLHNIVLAVFLTWAVGLAAQAPSNYYDAAEGKSGAELKTALHTIIKEHLQLEYYASATYFRTTDWHVGGYFWDMYSNIHRTTFSGLNREHNMPKSWWSTAPEYTVAYSDLHNLYPSDAEANTKKSNLPLGVVNVASYDNGVVKIGSSKIAAYNGNVFEPANEYKGDFARDYMYMVTCYEDYAPNWRSTGTASMLYNNTYPTFKPYAVELLLQWHEQDPVSQKEIDRNNAVYDIQKNRNPFIDHPEYVTYIWGDEKPTKHPDYLFVSNINSETKTLTLFLDGAIVNAYSIYNLSGLLVQSQYNLSDIDGHTLNVSRLIPGLYIITVLTENPDAKRMSKFVLK